MLRRIRCFIFISVANMMIVSCAQVPHPNPQDPLESFNRGVYGFNRTVDRGLIKPVAFLYWKYIPKEIQGSIGHFYDNLNEIPNVANDILQFRPAYAVHDTTRFLINTTLGMLGFFDVADSLGLEQHKNDFGQTLYHWGYKNSSYLVLPLLGPSTFRDGIGFVVDYAALSIWPWVDSDWRCILLGIDIIDTRARLLRNETVIDVVALDEYAFVRDAYFQRRQYLFNQGKEDDDELQPLDNLGNEVYPENAESTNLQNTENKNKI
ncbi:MAG: VacJ family lipoprotein [Candidatus Berkiellales bacterium]